MNRCAPRSSSNFYRLACTLLGLAPIAHGCSSGHHHSSTIVSGPGTVASDYQSLSDYLNDPTVRELLAHMPSVSGGSPPNVEGEYASSGTIRRTTIPGTHNGDSVLAGFCFGTPSGDSIEVAIQDPTVVDAGAASFIEGGGDSFTVYTAFKSVQTQDTGATCEIHEVNVFTAIRNPDGSLSDLWIGQGIVGVIGNCGGLAVGETQISAGTGTRTGGSCIGSSPGTGPQNPSNVLVRVENNLVTDLLVFLGDDTTPTLQLKPLSADAFETAPGFAIFFESLQPSAGQDGQGNDLLMGEIVSGQFTADATGPGGTVTYSIENQVGDDLFFAPLPLNRRSFDIFSVANLGVAIPGYPDPPGSGLDCLCSMAPSVDPYVIGYYSYSVQGVIDATQANVHFVRTSNNQEVDAFNGPFNLEAATGTVTLLVD